MKSFFLASLAAVGAAFAAVETSVPYPGPNPGAPQYDVPRGGVPVLKNACAEFPVGKVVQLATAKGEFSLGENTLGAPVVQEDGTLVLEGVFNVPEEAGLELRWRAELAEGAHYMRCTYTLVAKEAVVLTRFAPVNLQGGQYAIPGEVPGTPLLDEKARMFYGVELPMAQAAVKGDKATVGFDCNLPLKAGQEISFAAVAGHYPEGQLRRAFLAYVERERAMPYHPVVQYNCWYDHGLQPTEEKMIKTVEAYGRELVQKRGVKLDSFVLDDGWDDYGADLWQPNPKKFPNGFSPVVQAIRSIGSHFGIWISPLGGYSGQAERIGHARRMGLLPEDAQEMDLASPGYYKWYLDRCRNLMQQDGVNFFKWDRAGDGVSPHFMALLDISRELRKVNPELFLSTTVGTWPSPFWLMFVDCTWRTGSADVNWCGKGNNRERYMTYRDKSCYQVIVKRAPLYPLNSIMHHGIVLGTEFQGAHTSDARLEGGDPTVQAAELGGACESAASLDFPVNNNLRSDARMLFASGANQQELYLTPGMMNDQAWDDVAAALKWSHKWAPVLADSHWVGGDPEKGEPYGYAAWRAGTGATLALRNPDDQPRIIRLDAALFEPVEPADIRMQAAYADQRVQVLSIPVSGAVELVLQPFEVLVFQASFSGENE